MGVQLEMSVQQYNQYSQFQSMKNEQADQAELEEPEAAHQLLPPREPAKEPPESYYEQYVQLLQVEEKVRLDTLIEDLEANNIHYYPERDHNQFYLRLLHHSKDYRTLTLQVILGPFTTLINIFNETEPSYVHGLNCLYGSFGNVYLLSLLEWESEEEVAIKCIQFKDEDSQESLILRTIKEYTINKIASALKVGPKIIKIQEFDIVIYDKCIEFCMERCCLAEEYAFTEEDHSLLKLNLKKLHELKVVHCDIKASNLVYSKNFKAPVLLDFGFSKVLHTGPGTPTKTKYVGSLETCCKDMMKLYVSKGFGMVDLYFNDAQALTVALKSDPSRQTGNDLEDIVKFCDPPTLNFYFAKIYYFLYYDLTFKAGNEYIRMRRSDKNLKIMTYLDTLLPTENLREFFFQFFQLEWKESFLFHELVRSYKCSHRHRLQLESKCLSEVKEDDSTATTTPPSYFSFLKKIVNCKIDLYKLDNDLINFTQVCIGFGDFVADKLRTEDAFDFFLSHVGILIHNYCLRTKGFQLCWKICKIFLQRIPSARASAGESGQEKLLRCFSFLVEYCLQLPITVWKLRAFKRCICEILTLNQIAPVYFEQLLRRVIKLDTALEAKISLLLSLYRALMYQMAIWGSLFGQSKQEEKKMDQFIQKIETLYYCLSADEPDPYLEKLVKCDLFLLKSLIDRDTLQIETLENSFPTLKKQHCRKRAKVIRFIRIMHFYDNNQNEECRAEIEQTLSACEIPVVLRPEYFLLCNVYHRLGNTARCKRLYNLIERCLMTKEILYANLNITIAFEFAAEDSLETIWSIVSKSSKPYVFLLVILKRYFQCKVSQKGTDALLLPYHRIILQITHDQRLIECLERLSQPKAVMEDKIEVFERLIIYFEGVEGECKEEGERIKEKYTDKLIMTSYWLKNEFYLIIDELERGKYFKDFRFLSFESDPKLFDFGVKAYLMLDKPDKVKGLIRSLEDPRCKQFRFIERWIRTTSFIILFQHMFERSRWQEFREFLLAIVNFIDIHPVAANVNSFVQCLRYTFSQKVDFTQIDSGLQTILFPLYQWKYPLISFFHLESLLKMARLPGYLNRKELKLYMWRMTAFLPYLKHSQLKWFLQEYYQLALRLNSRARYERFILLKCRALMNYSPVFKRSNYSLKQFVLLQNSRLMEVILRKRDCIQEFIDEKSSISLSYFTHRGVIYERCKDKLKSYHCNVGNDLVEKILSNYQVMMKLAIDATPTCE